MAETVELIHLHLTGLSGSPQMSDCTMVFDPLAYLEAEGCFCCELGCLDLSVGSIIVHTQVHQSCTKIYSLQLAPIG